MKFSFPDKPLGIGELLDQGFRLTLATYRSTLGIITALVVVSVAGTLLGADQIDITNVFDQSNAFWAGVGLLAFLSLYLYVLMTIRIVHDAYGTGDFSSSLRLSLTSLIPILLVIIIYITVFTIGLLLFLIPGFYFAITLSLAVYVVVIESTGPFAALGRSSSLVKGSWFRAAMVLSVASLIVGVVYAALGFLVGLLGISAADEGVGGVIAGLLLGLVALVQPLMISFGLILYSDLRVRHEGVDLDQQIDAL